MHTNNNDWGHPRMIVAFGNVTRDLSELNIDQLMALVNFDAIEKSLNAEDLDYIAMRLGDYMAEAADNVKVAENMYQDFMAIVKHR